MKKTFLFLAALVMSAMMWAAEKTLTFDLSKNPGGWPTANSTELTEYTYTLDDVDYTFSLKNIKCNSGFLMLTQPAALGLPDIEGYKLTKVVAKNSSGCSTSVKVGISYSFESADYLSGGEVQTWATQSSSYTYTLTATTDNTVYYLYVTNKNAQITELALTYEKGTTPQRVLESIYIDGTATELEYFEGESFDVAGLKVMGKYDDELGDSEITAGIDWTVTPETLAKGTTSVSVTATAGGKTSDPKEIAVTVKEFVKTYANTYTSDVEYKIDSKVVWDGVEYDALKMAKNTPATITVPANTKNLHIHAAAWNKEGCEWTISGLADDVKITTTADAGVAGSSSTYTLQNNPETTDYFVISTNNSEAKEITITLPKDKRGVIFGINAELEQGVVVAPSFTPANGDFDQEVNVTLTAEEGAEIFYAFNEAVTVENAIKYTEPIELMETTTIYAIAKKDGKESAQVSKTYNLVPAYSVEEIAAITPTGQKAVLVLNDDEIVDIYAGQTGDVSGLYFQASAKKIELYNQNYAFSKEWKVGGKVSGRVMGEWVDFKGTWELKIATEEIDKLDYTAPGDPTALQEVMMKSNIRKAMHNGRLMIMKGDKMFNLHGMLVK